jgi:glyoxylase-like metal-dependent hydrolase (beta-lactamase superfamily II)
MEWRVISIGALASHPLWNERGDHRVGHATTTLIKSDGAVLLVDPSLPPHLMEARLDERWGAKLSDVTHVFLTSFDPDRRRTLLGLEHATWCMHDSEIQSAALAIQDELGLAENDPAVVNILQEHLELLSNFAPPQDAFLPQVDLFPTPGFTPGSCGLLLPTQNQTILITGDTVATSEHLKKGSVLQNCANIELAKESFVECVEIADVIVPGRDNVVLNANRPR